MTAPCRKTFQTRHAGFRDTSPRNMAIDTGSGGRRRGRPAEARRGARAAAPRAQTLVNWSLYRIGWVVVLCLP